MYTISAFFRIVLSLALVSNATAHGVALKAVGNAPGAFAGVGLGVVDSTSRTGTAPKPYQRDTTLFKDGKIILARSCGRTTFRGWNNATLEVPKLIRQNRLTRATADGWLKITWHQMDKDGGGPFICKVDNDGIGNSFTTQVTVTKNIPGNSVSQNQYQLKKWEMVVELPRNLDCKGQFEGGKDICMLRCQNFAEAGPFGTCIPFQQVR